MGILKKIHKLKTQDKKEINIGDEIIFYGDREDSGVYVVKNIQRLHCNLHSPDTYYSFTSISWKFLDSSSKSPEQESNARYYDCYLSLKKFDEIHEGVEILDYERYPFCSRFFKEED